MMAGAANILTGGRNTLTGAGSVNRPLGAWRRMLVWLRSVR
jgi:hypothetical protein